MVLSHCTYFHSLYARGQFEFNKFYIFVCYMLHVDFWLGLFFEPEDGGNIFLRNDH
jgi:hypothetical protein